MGEGLLVEPLRPQPGVFLVRPGHPLAGRSGIALADIVAFPLVLIGRIPAAVQAPIAAARAAAREAGRAHAAFPALIHESPTVALRSLSQSDAVLPVTLAIAAPALRAGEAVALPWREAWVSVHPGIVRLRNRAPGEAEEAFLDLLRSADREEETRRWPGARRSGCRAHACEPARRGSAGRAGVARGARSRAAIRATRDAGPIGFGT